MQAEKNACSQAVFQACLEFLCTVSVTDFRSCVAGDDFADEDCRPSGLRQFREPMQMSVAETADQCQPGRICHDELIRTGSLGHGCDDLRQQTC